MKTIRHVQMYNYCYNIHSLTRSLTRSLTHTLTHSLTHSLTHTHTVTVALSQLEYSTSEADGSVEVCVAVVDGRLLEDLTLTLTTADDTATSNGKT